VQSTATELPLRCLSFAKGAASLTRTCGRIRAIKDALWGAINMVFAIGILFLGIVAPSSFQGFRHAERPKATAPHQTGSAV
jgi:hypothetical protein